MPAGKSVQRGFVRGIGIPPSETDRKNKKQKVLPTEKKIFTEAEVSAKLEQLKLEHPELHAEAEKFARRFDSPKQKTDELTLKYLEDALQASKQAQHLDKLLVAYQSRSLAKH